MFEKPEEEQIIEARFDPVDWKQEVDRVYLDLANIEKEIELIKTQGGNSLDDQGIEDCRRHCELIVELCEDIKESLHGDTRKVFQRAGEQLTQDCEFIRKHEMRINQNSQQQIQQLNSITGTKKKLAVELRQIIDKVKGLDFENKNLSNETQTLRHRYEEKAKDLSGSGQVSRLKTAITALKVSWTL